MPAGKFDKLIDRGENLEVGGEFVTHGDVIGDVTVRFVLIPDDNDKALMDPIMGTATIDKVDRDPGSADLSRARFKAVVRNKFDLRRNTKVRGIGIAVAVKKPDPPGSSSNEPDPPGFETFTWCVNLEVT